VELKVWKIFMQC